MDFRLGIVRDPIYLEHKTGLSHPEDPGRLTSLYALLDNEFRGGFLNLPAFPASLSQIELVHSPAYMQLVLSTARRAFTNLTSDTPVSAQSYQAAWLAAGGCLQAVEALLTGQCAISFAMVRPPGHHSLPGLAGGFCIFNNLAIAACWARQKYGLKRILIVDWDVHHGNGIQEVFYRQREVFYLSSHYYYSYPHSGDWEEVGQGAGAGYTLNLCLPGDAVDDDVLHLYREILPQVVEGFDPQLILVAAGFDAHKDDPLGNTHLTEMAFAGLGALVRRLGPEKGIPLMLALEGGYNHEALTASVRQCLLALLGQGQGPEILARAQSDRGRALANKARQVHGPYGVWMGGMM